MNEEARQILIGRAVINSPIAYSTFLQQLGYDPYNPELLYNLLEEIAVYEKENGRPTLTVMAKYLNEDKWGAGFFDVATRLGYLKDGEKPNNAFARRMQKECHEYWVAQKLRPLNKKEEHQIPFFNKSEIDILYDWDYKVYDPKNDNHVKAKNFLLDTVWAKTAYWAEKIKSFLSDYDIINRRMWSQPGWDEGVQVSRFKRYTWARIFKSGDDKRDIFFTVGVNAKTKALVYKLDYFFEADSSLSEEQKALCEQLIPKELRWIPIQYNDIEQYDWDSLISLTVNFIRNNTSIYESIIKAVWDNKIPKEILRDKIILRNKPRGIDKLPLLNPSFEGGEKDYLADLAEQISTGTAGEDLVIKHEKEYLEGKDKPDLANRIEKKKDGCGYDILSFDENGNEKHIEVKTTSGGIDTPFYLSLNEWLYMNKYPKGYSIYRLFNYDSEKKIAEFYILENPKDELLFQASAFKCYIKE